MAEVDRSGGHEWSKDKKMQYANNLDHPETLIAVSKSANRSKGDKDPSDWMPTNDDYGCDYIKTWQKIKKDWGLAMDRKEEDFLTQKNIECSGNFETNRVDKD